ncbi:MAG: ribonuclease P protein component [Gemmatimonadetes bacterium]|nr:ribonuclease P protein component [Gemmatimonadota bacterium]
MSSAPREGERERRRLPRARRITRSREIRALFARGKRSRTAHLDVFDSPSPASHPRVGLVVARHGHRVVQRNRLKRRLREAVRQDVVPRLLEAKLWLDVLVRARREAYGAPYRELRDELSAWVGRRCSRASSSD